jgi:polyribonucleotide nucleotidyltransferase
MNARVLIKYLVDGIESGFIKEEYFPVLTNILGDEDHLGDIDFKVKETQIA